MRRLLMTAALAAAFAVAGTAAADEPDPPPGDTCVKHVDPRFTVGVCAGVVRCVGPCVVDPYAYVICDVEAEPDLTCGGIQ